MNDWFMKNKQAFTKYIGKQCGDARQSGHEHVLAKLIMAKSSFGQQLQLITKQIATNNGQYGFS